MNVKIIKIRAHPTLARKELQKSLKDQKTKISFDEISGFYDIDPEKRKHLERYFYFEESEDDKYEDDPYGVIRAEKTAKEWAELISKANEMSCERCMHFEVCKIVENDKVPKEYAVNCKHFDVLCAVC